MQATTPRLRFPEFSDEWQVKRLGDVFDVRDGTHESPTYFNTGRPLVTSKNLNPDGTLDLDDVSYISEDDFNSINKRSNVDIGDILFGMIGTIGNPVRIDSSDFAIKNVALIKQKSIPTTYLIHYLNSSIIAKQFYQKNAGGTQKFIALGDIRSLSIGVPSKPEQEKIAEFLTVVDERIAAGEKKLELLQKYKKGVMQKIFTQQIRFKDENGNPYPEWEEKRLGNAFDRVTNKNKENNQNILTISAQQGLVSQTDFFNKIVAAKNVTNYYLLMSGDFAYNKSYSAGYPMGAIKRLKLYEKGIVSTLYICFRAKDLKDNDFFEQVFEYGLQNSEIEKIAQEGARNHGLLNISVSDFFNIELTLPESKEEQQKIATLLTALDAKIAAEQTRLTAAKQWKKGLLQRMFV